MSHVDRLAKLADVIAVLTADQEKLLDEQALLIVQHSSLLFTGQDVISKLKSELRVKQELLDQKVSLHQVQIKNNINTMREIGDEIKSLLEKFKEDVTPLFLFCLTFLFMKESIIDTYRRITSRSITS